MKQRLRFLLGGSLVVSVLLLSPLIAARDGVHAATDTTSTPNSSSSTSGSTSTSSDTEDKSTADPTTVKQHIEQEKTQLKLKLTVLEQQKLVTKCIPTQVVVQGLLKHVDDGAPNRTKAYQELIDNLNSFVTKLKTTAIDTTTLSQEITTLSTKITAYKTGLADYQQALTDVKAIDCKADPTGFKAVLETARTKRQAVSAAVLDIRTYVTGTIKPTLQDIRTQLAASESTSTNSPTSGGNQ